MSAEITALGLAAILQGVQIGLGQAGLNRDAGKEWNMGPRDSTPELSDQTARMRRAVENHFEGLILFTIAVVMVTLTDSANVITALAAWLYLIARVLYVPAYALGWTPWRSVIWAVGFVATFIMIVMSLF